MLAASLGVVALGALFGGVNAASLLIVLIAGLLCWRPTAVTTLTYRAVRVLCLSVGVLAALSAIDYAAGRGWQALRSVETATTRSDDAGALDLRGVRLPPPVDPRADHPALRDAPWAARYFSEFEALDWEYVPFVGPRVAPVRGRFINSTDAVRRSYIASVDGDREPVEVWFFGGSTTWGEGQRDLHTIPSEVARLAEAEGIALHPVNFGQRGYAAFAEFLLFEQELDRRGPPDAVVFYDGLNELGTQTETARNLSRQPSIYQIDITRRAFEREPAQPRTAHRPEPSVAREYLQTSAVHKVWRALAGVWDPPAAQAQGGPGALSPADRERAVENAAAIYRRSIDLIRHVAAREGLEPLLFWQPTVPRSENPDYYALTERVVGDSRVVDLSRTLEDVTQPVFIDSGHTNERAARLVAEAIWTHLEPVAREAARS